MGVSFKISKVGTRFCPKLSPAESPAAGESGEGGGDAASDSKGRDELNLPFSKRKREEHVTQSDTTNSKDDHKSPVQEASFTLDLFPDGFSIGKPTEAGTLGPSLREMPKSLHPYNKSSEALFSAIEMGRLPGDILDDIPCKYFNGSIFCEVRDYRNCNSEPENVSVIVDEIPIVHKVCLHMTLENIVKDMPSITDDSWTYGDLMEVESRILKATQPQLCLDPIPMLDKLSETPVSNELDLGVCQARKKRLKRLGAVTVTSNNQAHGKKISIDRMSESANGKFGEMGPVVGDGTMHAHDHLAVQQSLMSKNFAQDATRISTPFSVQPKFQSAISYSKPYQDRGLATSTSSGLASSQDVINSYANNARNVQGMRESLDIQMAHMAAMRRSNQTSLDGLSQQSAVSTLDSIHGVDSNRKTTMLQHQIDMRGIPYSNVGSQKYSLGDARQIIPEGSSIQEGMASFYSDQRMPKQGVKEERMEMEAIKSEVDRSRDDSLTVGGDLSQMNQLHRQQAFVRAHFPNQSPWNNLGSLVERDHRKDEQLQKRRSVHSPRVSSGTVVQPPVSKSGDNSSGSMGPHCGPVSSAQGSQKDKAAAISGGAGGIPSVASSPNDSVQRQHQPPGSGKRKPSSASKNPSMGGVASPASVSNVNVPLNANSPSVGTPPLTDQILMERFSKIDAVTMRFQLNSKNNKVDECTMKPVKYSSQEVSIHLSNALNNEDVIEENNPFPLSNSLIGGSLNTCKSRTIDFMLTERLLQGNGVSIVVPKFRDKLSLIERSRDRMVALVPGEIDENGHVPYLDLLPAFPNTCYADLFGTQFCYLMVKEGYQIMDDRIRAAPTRLSNTTLGSCNAVGTSSDILPSEAQYGENVSGQLTSTVSLANSGLTPLAASQNVMSSPRLLPSGSVQGVQMSQGFFPGGGIPARPPTLEQTAIPPQPNQQSHIQQNQQNQMPKSMLMQNNPLSHLGVINQGANINMGNSMVNKPNLQLRIFQPQQHQQPSQMSRKMVMGLGGAMGMGNMGNNTVGLGGLNSAMGMRGIGPGISAPMGLASGISAPMGIGSSPGMSSLAQNPMNMSQNSSISNVLSHMRSGSFTHAQAAAVASKLMRGTLGGQAGIGGMAGNNQMHSSSPLSMLGQNLTRSNMNLMQRTPMATMGPPKGREMNMYLNPEQQLQQLQQKQQHVQQLQLQHHQQQQQQQQQQQHQQQQTGSPLQNPQAIVSPSQVGSPAMSIQQQLSQQQQIGSPALSQQNPMSPQLSAGALQQMNNVGNAAGPAPASPQLSSQTLGSVGSISSSPMELQGVNKGNSISNV